MIKKPPNLNYWINHLSLQCLLAVLLSGLFWGIFNGKTALAALAGGLTSCLSNLIFAAWFFSVQGFAQQSKKIVSAFYVGEGLKIFSTTALFAVAIKYLQLPFLALLVAYLMVHLGISFIALLRKSLLYHD